jgi:Putative prokaryotic signal transducing protein
MAQDPESDERELRDVDPSHELDLVTLFSSSNIDAEMEANTIHNLLQASGIPSVIVGASTIPSLEFQVQVPRETAEEAERLLREARAAGPEAAAEAEAASEESGAL